jgi:hypothetical protein
LLSSPESDRIVFTADPQTRSPSQRALHTFPSCGAACCDVRRSRMEDSSAIMSNETPTGRSHARHNAPSTALNMFRAVVLLSLPTIVGTAFFLIGVVVLKTVGPGDAPADPFGEPTAADRIRMAVAFTLFMTCYFGAAFGPILLPLAAQQEFALTRAIGARSSSAIWAWTFVLLAVVATCLFWGWLVNLDIFV